MRTTGVKLVAEVADYLRSVSGADKATRGLKDTVDDVKTSADRTGDSVDDLGGDFRDTARDAKALKDEIQSVEKSLAGLAAEFAATSTAAERIDLTKSIRAQQGELRQLLRIEKLLPTPGEVQPATRSFGANIISGIGAGIQSAPVAAGGALIGAALAPTIAAGIGAGISGGVGLAAIVGGITLISKDPQVAAAGKDVGQRFANAVSLEAESFKKPVLGALDQIDAAAGRIAPKIGAIFRNTAPSVDSLTGSVIRASEAITDGLVAASGRSQAPLKAIGNLVESVGVEFGHMIDTLSQRSPEGVSAIDDITGAATRAVRATTAIVDGAAKVKGWTDNVDGAVDSGRAWIEDNSALAKQLKGVGISLDLTADGYKKGSAAADLYRLGVIGNAKSLNNYDNWLKQTSSSTNTLASQTAAAEKPQRALVGTLNDAERAALGERNSMIALSNQLRAQANPAFALIEAQKSLKTAQDRAAAATKAHGKNSDEARTATRQLALAALDMQAKAGALSTTFNGKLSPSMRHTLEAAGLTGKQIDAVAREFRDAKKDGDRYAKKYQANVTITGHVKVDSELARLLAVQQALRSGNPLTAGVVNKAMRDVLGPQLNRADGGHIDGPGSETSDDIPIMGSKNEYMVRAYAAKKIGRRGMDYINKYGELPVGLAEGGPVRWPYPTTAARAWVPSQAWASARVAPPIGHWPSSPGAQRGDSGVWHSILAMVKASGIPYKFGNAYRPGDPLWHGSGRAIDFMGYNQNRLANFFMARQSQVLELIHRTNSRDYGITRGHYNAMPTQWPLHRNHLHIAMAGGGVIREPVVGVGASGTTYSLAENGPETVTPGLPQYTTAGGGNVTTLTTINLSVAMAAGANLREAGRQIAEQLEAHLSGGGQIRVNGRLLVGTS